MPDRAVRDFAFALDKAIDATEPDDILRQLCERYELSNVVYLGVNIPGLTDGGIYVSTTYPDSWKQHYIARHYERVDPVVQSGLRRVTPLDWSEVDRTSATVQRFFGEAAEFGIGNQGLSFPIRGAHGELALFSINSHHSDGDWSRLKQQYMREFQTIAFYLHNVVLESCGIEFDVYPSLTPREIECLKWAAAGKTEWATGKILRISVRTVNFHLENAKVRLNCVTKTQAVAKAVRLALI